MGDCWDKVRRPLRARGRFDREHAAGIGGAEGGMEGLS